MTLKSTCEKLVSTHCKGCCGLGTRLSFTRDRGEGREKKRRGGWGAPPSRFLGTP